MSTIGERIAQLRLHRGMTQSELGEAIGETKQTIYKYEHGIVVNIPLAKIEAIAAVLRCPPTALTGWNADAPVIKEEHVQTAPGSETREKLLKAFDQLDPAQQEMLAAYAETALSLRKAQDTH